MKQNRILVLVQILQKPMFTANFIYFKASECYFSLKYIYVAMIFKTLLDADNI